MFVLATKVSPTEYKKLTLRERAAFIEALNEVNGGS